jgi:hypothetical protein
MEEAPDNGKDSSHSAHANGMNECMVRIFWTCLTHFCYTVWQGIKWWPKVLCHFCMHQISYPHSGPILLVIQDCSMHRPPLYLTCFSKYIVNIQQDGCHHWILQKIYCTKHGFSVACLYASYHVHKGNFLSYGWSFTALIKISLLGYACLKTG